MDSSVYRYFIRELQEQPHDGFSLLPLHFARSQVVLDPESFSSLHLFLKSVICAAGTSSAALLPEIFAEPRIFFGSLFIEAHKALLDVLTGIEPQSHPFRYNGAHLARFLSFCATNNQMAIMAPTDACGRAMLCFLMEGLIHAGWCPNAFEGIAKRAAHSYFVSMKKTLRHMQTGQKAAVLGYLWGAWLLAQKTDGIRDNPLYTFSAVETFEWNIDNENQFYLARNFGKPSVICLIPKSPHEIPHPVFRISCRGKTGLSLYVNNEPVMPEALLEESEIVRPRIAGNKFVYKCRTDAIPGLLWTVVFLLSENTVYRIDVLKLPPCVEPIAIRAEMRLENEARLEEVKKGYFIGNGPENSVIRFIQDPLGFRLGKDGEYGISAFTSGKAALFSGSESMQLVCAWARGKGITALNEIKLLGIFD
jgi:hypothetical protein